MGEGKSKSTSLMDYRTCTVVQGELRLEYYVYGSGQKTIICMHGHGRGADDFAFLAAHERKVISIHLFHHGNSVFPENRIEKDPLRTEEFLTLFLEILENEQVQKFHLFAFSQGGRFSLCLLPEMPERILSLTLISPDGMDNNSFYNWSSRRPWARRLFVRWEKNPKKLKRLSKIATSLKLMRPKVRTFVNEFSDDRTTFKRASLTWRGFRMLQPDPLQIGKTIEEHKTPFLIIMGSHDQVIRPKQAYDFARRCKLDNVVQEVNNGHNFFKPTSINKFIQFLPFLDKYLYLLK
jgi:pimeloyl-ACP methyl ester carboxylesterase